MAFQYQVNPSVPVPGSYYAAGASVRATLPAAIFDRKLLRLAVNGPPGTRCDVYRDTVMPASRLDSTARGQSNTADYPNPIPVLKGSQVIVEWTRTGGLIASDAALSNATFFVEGM